MTDRRYAALGDPGKIMLVEQVIECVVNRSHSQSSVVPGWDTFSLRCEPWEEVGFSQGEIGRDWEKFSLEVYPAVLPG